MNIIRNKHMHSESYTEKNKIKLKYESHINAAVRPWQLITSYISNAATLLGSDSRLLKVTN